MTNKHELLSVADAAKVIGVSERRVQQYCLAGRIGFLVGHRYVITRKEAKQFRANPPGVPLSKKK